MRCVRMRFIGGLCILATGAAIGQDRMEPHQDFVCTSGVTTRLISVFNLDAPGDALHAGGCRVDYTKDARTTTLYTSRSSRAYCAAKAALLVTKLVDGNFRCRARTTERPGEE